MQIIVRTLLIGAMVLIGTNVVLAADPATGTWQINLAKSTFSPGPAPKVQTRSYAESPQGITLTLKTTGMDGKESTVTLTYKDDSKPYPESGSPDIDTVSVTRINALTIHSIQTKAGIVVGTGVRTLSTDGKTLTFAQKGTHADGRKYDDVLVYDRQ